jgi:hypothetical protein
MRSALHGGLTPPALGAVTTTVCRKNGDFCDAQTHICKSGGRQPAVVRDMNAVPWKSSNLRRLANTRSSTPRGAYAPRSWLHVRMPLQMGDFRRGERYGGVAAASALVHWVEDGQFSPRSERCFSRGWLTPPLRMYRARLLQRQRERCAIPVHASGERRLHAVGKCVSTAQDVDLNLFQDWPSAPCSGENFSTACCSAIGEAVRHARSRQR